MPETTSAGYWDAVERTVKNGNPSINIARGARFFFNMDDTCCNLETCLVHIESEVVFVLVLLCYTLVFAMWPDIFDEDVRKKVFQRRLCDKQDHLYLFDYPAAVFFPAALNPSEQKVPPPSISTSQCRSLERLTDGLLCPSLLGELTLQKAHLAGETLHALIKIINPISSAVKKKKNRSWVAALLATRPRCSAPFYCLFDIFIPCGLTLRFYGHLSSL